MLPDVKNQRKRLQGWWAITHGSGRCWIFEFFFVGTEFRLSFQKLVRHRVPNGLLMPPAASTVLHKCTARAGGGVVSRCCTVPPLPHGLHAKQGTCTAPSPPSWVPLSRLMLPAVPAGTCSAAQTRWRPRTPARSCLHAAQGTITSVCCPQARP